MKRIFAILTLLALPLLVQGQTNTNSVTIWHGLETLASSIGSSAPSNFVVAPYGSYALNNSSNRWGGGIFGGWNVNQNIGLGAAIDYANGGFTMFSGQLTLRLPMHPLAFVGWTNFSATPFVLGGLGTPVSGAGHAAGNSVASIAAAGAEIDLLRFGSKKEWHLGMQGTLAQWSGSGSQDGKHIYGGLTLSRGF